MRYLHLSKEWNLNNVLSVNFGLKKIKGAIIWLVGVGTTNFIFFFGLFFNDSFI